jgi:putative polysaccharide biosynthesis protein
VASQNLIRRAFDPRGGRVVREVRTALANRESVPLRRQLAAWRRGFYAGSVLMYDLERYDLDAYISDFDRVRTLASINDDRYILDDKLIAYLYLRAMGLPTPTVHGQIRQGEVVWLAEEPPPGGLDGLLDRRGRVAVKARAGSSGSGFAVLTREAGTTYVNGRPVDDAVHALTHRDLIICDYVEQHERLAVIYPGTTNTMRVITFRDVDTGEPFVAFASHRFGTARSVPVDNFGAGGLSAGIDITTGVFTPAFRSPGVGRRTSTITWIDEHPETGARITGVEVPNWELAREGVLRAMRALPGSRYVGWDVALTQDGMSIIEGNNRGDVVLQAHMPMALDPRVRKVLDSARR